MTAGPAGGWGWGLVATGALLFPEPDAFAAAVAPPPDPWGRPFRYARVTPTGPVRIWSVGPDGIDGTADDVGVP